MYKKSACTIKYNLEAYYKYVDYVDVFVFISGFTVTVKSVMHSLWLIEIVKEAMHLIT